MRFILAISAFLLLSQTVQGQINFDLIPAELLVDANSIILESKEKFTIHSIYKTTFHHQSTTAILKNITHEIMLRYDKLSKYENVSIIVKDQNGKKVHAAKMNKMDDVALSSHNTILSDDRALIYKIPYGLTPYTVELEYVLTSEQTFHLQPYLVTQHGKQSILKSSFEIENYDTSNKINFNDFYFGKPQAKYGDLSTIYFYELKNLSVSALYQSFESKRSAYAKAKLDKFQMEGYVGDYTSWSDFGIWLSSLMEGSDYLNNAAKKEILSLFTPTDTRIEKIQKLYTYLQNNMRYISIQLGVGGYKPFPAQYVHDNKYGDCKALSHYMKTLLDIAEVPSYYTVIYSGDDPPAVKQDSVGIAFNHAVIMIPLESDTIFLECTSASSPMGFAGSWLGNRKAFIIDGENSRLVNTTHYSPKDNRIISNYAINIDKEFNASVLKTQTLAGSGADLYNYFALRNEPQETFKQFLQKFTPHTMSNLEFIDRRQDNRIKYPEFTYSVKFNTSEKVSRFGNRLQIFLDYDPLPMDLIDAFKSSSESLEIRFGYTIRDTFEISHPGNCFLEKNITHSNLEAGSSSFSIETSPASDHIVIFRETIINDGIYKNAEKEEMLKFWSELNAKLKERLILNCKT